MAGTRNPWEENYGSNDGQDTGAKPWEQAYQQPEAPKSRTLGAVANDTVIEVANAAAGGVSSAANFIKPGNAVSGWIDKNIVKAGEDSQSDVTKAAKQQFRDEVENADGVMGELGAVGKYVVQNPLLSAAQAAGSFVGPGLAVKAAGFAGKAAQLGAKGVERAGRAGGVAAGAAMAGGDAAGTAYELSRKAGATEDQAVDAGRQASVIPAIVGGVSGMFGAERLLAGAKGFSGGAASRALKTGASEAAQEGFEEGVTQYEGQRAAMPYDASIDPSKGVAAAAGMGAALGGITGAGTSLLTGGNAAQPGPSQQTPPPAPANSPATGPTLALPAPDPGVIAVGGDGTARTPAYQPPGYVGDVTDVVPKAPRAPATDFASILDTDSVYSGWSNVQDGSDRATMRDQMAYVGRAYGGNTTPENAAEVAADLSQQFKWFRAASPDQKQAAINSLMTPAVPADPVRAAVESAANAGGALSPAALVAIDSGVTPRQESAFEDVPELGAQPPQVNLDEITDPYDRAYYESLFDDDPAQLGAPPVLSAFLQNDDDIPDFDAASNATDEDFLRALGADEQEIQDAIATTPHRAESAPEGAALPAGPQANVAPGTPEGAGAGAGQPAGPVTDAPTNLRDALAKVRAQKQEAANAQAAPPQAAPAAVTPTTTQGTTDATQTAQAQQTSAQPAQAGPAQPAQGLTDAAPAQNPGAQGTPAPGTQAQTQGAAWDGLDPQQRTAVLSKAGWITNKGGLNVIGKRLLNTSWEQITGGTREIIARNIENEQGVAATAGVQEPPSRTPEATALRLGRDSTPLSEGGKPFKTRKAAGDAKKQQPMMRVVTVPGGFALAEKTPAQLAAEAKAARRLAQPRTGTAGEPLAAHEFIAAEGGLSSVAAADLGVDGSPRIGNRRLFAGRGRGMSMEQAAEKLIADGYLGEGATINDAYNLIKLSLSRPQYNADGIERIAEAEVQTRFDDYLAAQEEAAAEGDADPFGMAGIFTTEELDDVGYTDADPALQAEVSALIAQAEALGIDTYDILEDIARTHANSTQDQYNAAARDALAEAIARSNQDGGGTSAQAAPAAEPAADQELDQPEALELASQTPAEAAAQQDAVEQAAKAEAARQRAADAQAARDEERKRIAQASVRAAAEFELGQDPLDSLTGQGSMFDDAPAQQTTTQAAADDDGRERFTLSIEMFGDVPYIASKPVDAGSGEVVSSRVITTKTKLTAANAQALGLPKDKGTLYAWRVSVIRRANGETHSVIEAMATDNGRSPDGEVLAHFKEVENPEAMERIAPAIANAALADWRAAQPQQAPTATETVVQPTTRADVTAAQQQAATLIGERIDAMTAGEVNTIARRFLPTMGVRPTVSKERNKAAVVDFTKVNPLAAAGEFGATLPADVRRVLQADMEGRVADAGQDDGINPRVPRENRAPAKAPTQGEQKEPWQMTALEFSQQPSGNPHWNKSYAGKDDGAYLADTAATHALLVRDAVAAGKLPESAKAESNAGAAQPDTPKLTPAEAKSLMAWEDLGQKDGVKTHALTFYESQADKDAKRGRMIVAKVSKGDRSATAWMVDGEDKTFGMLAQAKKLAEEVGMAKAVADGYVEEGDAPANDRNVFTLKRMNQVTGKMEPVTFERGEYVRHKLGHGEIDGISQARSEFRVDGVWQPFGFAYKAERPAAPERKDVAPLSKVIDKMNAKHGAGLTDADRVPAPSTTPKTDAHAATMQAVRDGKTTPERLQESFDAVVANADAIKAELSTKTKAELLRVGGPFVQMRYANEKKADVVDAVYREILGEYALGESVTYGMGRDSFQNAVRKLVEATDADKLAQYVTDRQAAAEQAQASRAARAEALENPKTLDDFRNLLNAHIRTGKTRKEAFLMLAPEQRIKYDTLEAESTREARETRKRTQKTQVRAAGQTTAGEIVAAKHTRDGYDLFVVKLADRLNADDYKTVLASAKKLGGWYSAFRGNGAIPGFQFKDKTNAEAFLALAGGDTTAAQEQVAQRRDAFEDDRSQTAVERLRAMADKMEAQAKEAEGRDRKANTERRARFASAALQAAAADKAKAQTMRNIAQAIEDGKARFLDDVRTKSQVDMLNGTVDTAKGAELRAKYPSYADQEKHKGEPPTAETADFADFPSYSAFRSDLATLGRQMMEVDGTKKLGQRLLSVADDVTDSYLDFAKANFRDVSQFGRGDSLADFASKDEAERAIKRSGLTGKAIVLPIKRGQNRVILSPGEAIGRGVWKGDGDKRITLTAEFGAEMVEAIGRRGNKQNQLAVPWQFQTAYDRRKALARIGIETPSEFRAALREYIDLKEQAVANRTRAMELQMVGRKADGLDFFPTSAEVADQMIEAADLSPDMSVLEPSAGMGHLADRIREAGAEPDVIEISSERRALLEEKGYTTQDVDDFLDLKPREFFTFGDTFRAPDGAEGIMRGANGNRVRLVNDAGDMVGAGYYDRAELTGVTHNGTASGYDRIIMNPPFSNRRDAEHVRHAYSLLKPGGRIVAIMGEGVFFGNDKKAQEFREWLESVGGTSEKLPDGSFLDPSLPVTTGANARMVVIDKAEGAAMFSRTPATKAAYEARIDALYAGGKPLPHGVRVLDRSDMLGLLGMGSGPVHLVESKVEKGRFNHGLSAADWKKVPGWLDDPAMVFDSETQPGRLVFIAPEKVNGSPVRMIVDPRPDGQGVNLLVNAYDADRNPFQRWERDGLMRYFDQQKAPSVTGSFQPRLTGLPGDRGRNKILTEKHLGGYRRANTPAAFMGQPTPPADSNARNVATQLLVDGLKAKWTRAPEIIVARNMQDAQIPQAVRDYDETLKSQGATGEARGFIYKGKVYLLSDQLKGPQQIAEVLFHEVLGHYGLRGVFGKGLDSILQQMSTMRRKEVVAKAREYGLFDSDALGGLDKKAASDAQIWAAMSAKERLSAAEEVLAEMAQTQPNIGFVQRAIAAIRNWLRAHVPGFERMHLTDADIVQAYILPARGYVTRSNETAQQAIDRAMTAFSRSSEPVSSGAPDLQGDGMEVGDDIQPAMFSRAAVAGKAAGDAIKSVTVTNIKKKAGFKLTDYLGLGLQALGRRQIVDIYGDMLPLAEYNTLVAQMEADKNEGGAEADQLVKRWAELPDEAKLADLMHDATLAQIDPDKPYVDGDDKAAHMMLQGRFKALSDDAKAVYRATRDAYQAHHAKVRSAIKERIERSEIKGARKTELLQQMDSEFFKAVKGVYFPLARFGQYAVTVKGADGKVESVSRAETKAEAEALRNSLLSAFPRDKGFTVGRVMLSKDFIADRDAVGRGFMTELYQVLDKQDMDAAQRAELEDTLGQLYLSSLPDLSWAKHGIHRKGTPGFSQDARRAYAQNMFHGSRYLAKLRYSDLMQDELTAMQKHVDDWREVEDFDQNSAQRVVDEMNKRHESLMNPKSNPLSTALTSLGFVFHLGLSPASAMVNLSQTALVAYPIMGAKWGFGKASAALLKASAEAAKGKNDITASLNADELAAYNEAVRAGTIDVTMAHDLAGIAQGEDAGVIWKIRPVMRWASFLFHHAERFNRQVTFVASYRLAREAGADQKAAFEQATKATYDGHFDYGAANRPRVMQGNVAKVLLLFKQYGQNMVYTLSRSAYQSIKGTDAEKAEARKVLAGLLTSHAMAAGVLGLPMVTTLLAAASMIGGDEDEPWDAQTALQNMLADAFGQKPAEVLAHGLSRLTPWDISGRVGLDRLIFPDVQEGLEGQRLAESAMAAALGPVAGIGVNVLKGAQHMSEGRFGLGLEAMLPSALRGPVKAIRYANEGVQDKSGISILDEVGPAAVAGQALGFSPSQARNAQEGKSAVMAHDRALGERRQELLTRAARASMTKDSEALDDARKEIARFNEKNPGRRINPNHIMQSVHNRQKRIDQAQDGVYLPKSRRDAMQAGRFAFAESE